MEEVEQLTDWSVDEGQVVLDLGRPLTPIVMSGALVPLFG